MQYAFFRLAWYPEKKQLYVFTLYYDFQTSDPAGTQ
jgi:hypothetical protein